MLKKLTWSALVALFVPAVLLPAVTHAEPSSTAPVEVSLGVTVYSAAACKTECIQPVGNTDAALGRDLWGTELVTYPAADPAVYPMRPTTAGTGFVADHGIPAGERVTFAVHTTDRRGDPRVGYLRRDPDGRFHLTAKFTRAQWFTIDAVGTVLDATHYVEILEPKNRRTLTPTTRRRPSSPCKAWSEETKVTPDRGGTHVFLQLRHRNGKWVTMTRQTTRSNGTFDLANWGRARRFKTRQYDISMRGMTNLQRVYIPGNVVHEDTVSVCTVVYGGA